MKKLLVLSLLVASSAVAQQNNIGSCGWGSKLFDGQRGVAPQVLGATTNGTSGNQTFAITSGTSGCTQDGAVNTSWKTAMYIDSNKTAIARDMANGQGESLVTLARVMGMDSAQSDLFAKVSRENFARIFPSENATTSDIASGLNAVLAETPALSSFSVLS